MDTQSIFEFFKRLGGLTHHLDIDVVMEGQNACGEMTITRRHTGAPGVAHGGVIMTLLDTAMGACAASYGLERGRAISTVELKVNLLRPVLVGQTLVTTTRIESGGKSLVVVSGAALIKGSEERVAFGVGTFNLYDVDMEANYAALEAMAAQFEQQGDH